MHRSAFVLIAIKSDCLQVPLSKERFVCHCLHCLFQFWVFLYMYCTLHVYRTAVCLITTVQRKGVCTRSEQGVSFSHSLFIKTLAMPEETQKRNDIRLVDVIVRRKGELHIELQPHDVQSVVGEDSTPHLFPSRNGAVLTIG